MSKFAELIHVKKGLCGSAQLNRNTSPDQITAVLSLIEDNCNMLKEISDALGTDGSLDNFLKNCQEDVVRSFLGADLLQLYKGVYFERGLGFQEMLKNSMKTTSRAQKYLFLPTKMCETIYVPDCVIL